jgi:hypothetical protein
MNTTCCCNTKDLRWFNNGKNIINVSSDFIDYRKYAYVSCKNNKVNRCFGDLPNQNSSSARTALLKGNVVYSVQVCNPYYVEKTCNPYQSKLINNYGCKCTCIPKY